MADLVDISAKNAAHDEINKEPTGTQTPKIKFNNVEDIEPPYVVMRNLTEEEIQRKCAELLSTEKSKEMATPSNIFFPKNCSLCGRLFDHRERYEVHIENHDDLKFKCDFNGCGHMYMDIDDLHSHLTEFHEVKARDTKNSFMAHVLIPCTTCARFFHKGDLAVHEKDHVDKIYECRVDTCEFTYEMYQNLRVHYENKHGLYVSPFESHNYRLRKEEEDVMKDNEICSCPICQRPFLKKMSFDKHIMTHNSERNVKCAEDGCGWTFGTFHELRQHYSRNHKTAVVKTNYGDVIALGSSEIEGVDCRSCPVCARLFKGQFDGNHVRYHDQLKFKCLNDGCGWMYESYHSMRDHYFAVHNRNLAKDGETKYLEDGTLEMIEKVANCATCSVCTRNISESKLKEHEDCHREMSHMYKCPESSCGWMFENYDCLKGHCFSNHELIVTSSRTTYLTATDSKKIAQLECSKCKRKMPEDKYVEHLQNHDSLKFICKRLHCGWLFGEFDEVRIHYMAKHGTNISSENEHDYIVESKQTEFFCSKCGRRFIKKSVLDLHLEGHDTLKYKCTEKGCGWLYENSYGLKVHRQSVHDLVPEKIKASLVPRECQNCTRKVQAFMFEYHAANCHQFSFTCAELGCGWKYDSAEKLKDHVRRKHTARLSNIGSPDIRNVFQKQRKSVEDADRDYRLKNCSVSQDIRSLFGKPKGISLRDKTSIVEDGCEDPQQEKEEKIVSDVCLPEDLQSKYVEDGDYNVEVPSKSKVECFKQGDSTAIAKGDIRCLFKSQCKSSADTQEEAKAGNNKGKIAGKDQKDDSKITSSENISVQQKFLEPNVRKVCSKENQKDSEQVQVLNGTENEPKGVISSGEAQIDSKKTHGVDIRSLFKPQRKLSEEKKKNSNLKVSGQDAHPVGKQDIRNLFKRKRSSTAGEEGENSTTVKGGANVENNVLTDKKDTNNNIDLSPISKDGKNSVGAIKSQPAKKRKVDENFKIFNL